MTTNAKSLLVDWRAGLPTLISGQARLREPGPHDVTALVALLTLDDACVFGVDQPITVESVERFLERAVRERSAGRAFTYGVAVEPNDQLAGLIHVRQLDPTFDAAEIECTIAPAFRGTGLFLDAAQLVGSFAFGEVGARRLEARVRLHNGRANAAMRKLGAVEEGILRKSLRRGQQYFDQVLWSLLTDDWRARILAGRPRVH